MNKVGTVEPGTHADAEDVARLRLALSRIGRQLRKHSSGGLSASQISALASIDRDGPIVLGDLAAIEQIAPASVTRLVDKLGALGLVERTRDAEDRRAIRVATTDEGSRLLREIRTRRSAWLAMQLEHLTPDQTERLFDALDALEQLSQPAPQ